MNAPVEYGQIVGYALACWPTHTWAPGFIGNAFEVYDTVEEARAARNWANADGTERVRIVEVREVVIE